MITCLVSQQSSLDLPFKEKELLKIIHKLLRHNRFSKIPQPGIISLVFVDDKEMREMNCQFRKIDKTTDVLSFELQENTPEGYLFGELIISLPKASQDAKNFKISLEDELIRLIVHGLTHLLGYDHATIQQEEAMQAIESDFYKLVCPMEDQSLYG